MVNMDELALHLQHGRSREASALVTQAMAENYPTETIIKQGFITGLRGIKEQYWQNEVRFPEVYKSVRALYRGIGQIREVLQESPVNSEDAGTVVIGAVEGDTADTVKNITTVLMEGRGLRVIDLGTCVSTDCFIRKAKDNNADVIVCSAALVTTMQGIKNLVQTLTVAGIREKVKVIITGKPVTERYRRLIGADYYAPDAASIVELAAACCKNAAKQ
jgi:methanogenic corrinoid protein MtbC1